MENKDYYNFSSAYLSLLTPAERLKKLFGSLAVKITIQIKIFKETKRLRDKFKGRANGSE